MPCLLIHVLLPKTFASCQVAAAGMRTERQNEESERASAPAAGGSGAAGLGLRSACAALRRGCLHGRGRQGLPEAQGNTKNVVHGFEGKGGFAIQYVNG